MVLCGGTENGKIRQQVHAPRRWFSPVALCGPLMISIYVSQERICTMTLISPCGSHLPRRRRTKMQHTRTSSAGLRVCCNLARQFAGRWQLEVLVPVVPPVLLAASYSLRNRWETCRQTGAAELSVVTMILRCTDEIESCKSRLVKPGRALTSDMVRMIDQW